MTRIICVSCAIVMGLPLVASCKDQQACEKSRMDLAKTWRQVKETAGARALPEPDEELTDLQKTERKQVWSQIEQKAYRVEGSFKTERVSWDAADQARGEITRQYNAVPSKDSPLVVGFGRMLAEANTAHDQFKKNCR